MLQNNVVFLLAKGRNVHQIARYYACSVSTIRGAIRRVCKKLRTATTIQMVVKCVQLGILEREITVDRLREYNLA